jgi:hypothetical protein
MKKLILLIGCLISISAFPQGFNINGRFSSSVYSFERFDTTFLSGNYLTSFQMLNLSINKDNVSLRSFMNYESDLVDNIDGGPMMRFYNLYLEVRNLFDIATIKIGRQPVFNNAAGGIFDGLNIDLKEDGYKFNAYGGGNVPAYQKLEFTNDLKQNFIFGGKFSTDAITDFQVTLSYIDKNFQPESYWTTRLDAQLNPIQVLIENNSTQYQFAFAEVAYDDSKDKLSVITDYDYDLNFDQTSKVEIDGNYSPLNNFKIDLYYNFSNPLIRYNSIFSVFNYGSSQEAEVGADYIINKNITLTGKFGDVVYQDANSARVTVGLSSNYGSLTYRKTFGYAGELDALSLYWAYSFYQGLLTPSLGVSYTNYKLSPDPNQPTYDLTSVLAGINVRPLKTLSFDLQGQYMDNQIYRNDFRFFLKLNYWFNTNFN